MIAEPHPRSRTAPSRATGKETCCSGRGGHPQVGMLTERTTRFTMLFALPYERTAPTVRRALGRTIRKLPARLARTGTWDQGVSWPSTRGSRSTRRSMSSSAIPRAPGNEGPLRTPWGSLEARGEGLR
jgi:hypothetical protein